MKLKIITLLSLLTLITKPVYATNSDIGLRTLFLNNKSIICGINIRNFNSKDLNKNRIIDNNEESGNFIRFASVWHKTD